MTVSGRPHLPGRSIGLVVIAAALGAIAWQVGAGLIWTERASGHVSAGAPVPPPISSRVTALGRLQPQHGVIRVAGPSLGAGVIAQLLVEKGDNVSEGQTLAVLDNYALLKTAVARLEVELDNARNELQRHEELYRQHVVSISERDGWRLKVSELQAEIQHAQAEADQALVRAPIAGQVLDVHARPGERVGADGIVELGDVERMYAVAEVYETDITRVRAGQHATVTSTALSQPLHGTVERIGLKIGTLDLLDTDPAARTDARIVPVEIRLDDSHGVASLTNLQVEVAIEP